MVKKMKLKTLLIVSALTSLSCFSMAANASWFSSSDADSNKIPTTLEGLLAVSETHVFSGEQFATLPDKLYGEYAVIVSKRVLAVPQSQMNPKNPVTVNLCRNAINSTLAIGGWNLPTPDGMGLSNKVGNYCSDNNIQYGDDTAH